MADDKTSRKEDSESSGGSGNKGPGFLDILKESLASTNYAAWAILLITFGFLGFLIFGVLGRGQVLDQLKSIEYARGLITYILAVGTMAIAMLVTVGGLLTTGSEDAEKRFTRGKEVLTVLIGVLGTIVGFYYGSQASERAGPQKTSIAIPWISNRTPFVGDRVEMTTLFSGGVPPYEYEISFENAPENAPWKRKTGRANDAGWAVEGFELIDAKAGKLMYQIKVTDAKGATNSYTSDETTCLTVKAKQVEKPKVEPIRTDANTAGARPGR